MPNITCAQLREKDVINLCDGTRLGFIDELEFDACSGHISSLVLCRNSGILGFSKDPPLLIPWSRIECIGEDAVLVKIACSEIEALRYERKRRNNRSTINECK